MRPTVGVLLIGLFAAGCGGGVSFGGTPHAEGAAGATATETHTIDAAVSVPPGSSRVIYSVHGRSAAIGRFVGACRKRAAPGTVYKPTRKAADATVAVDGRGVSRAATVVYGQRLNGGRRPSGVEHWLIRMGRENEDVTVEASLEVVRQRGGPDCTFWLYGSFALLRR